MSNYKLYTKKYNQQGDITWEYNSLRNIKKNDGEISNFQVDNKKSGFNFNLENPVDIECQPSYDGTVNLILNDDFNPPRIINTRWTRTENNTYKLINRDQINQSNLYREDLLDRETRLFRNVNGVTKIDLYNVSYFGKLKCGNYIIYMKYMDDDYNETDIIAQTGVISIFNGTYTNPLTVSGGLMDEETDKSIVLSLRDLDTSFTYYTLYVYRTSCDANGLPITNAYKIDKKYEINNESDIIYINGHEDIINISVEELNVQYNIVEGVKSQAQVQNMLFFANVSKTKEVDSDLQNMSLYIKANEHFSEESIGFIDATTYKKQTNDDPYQVEYYSPINIYYKLGYWPDEIYRFGIVYIYNDDHLSPVYNLRGCQFSDERKCNIIKNDKYSDYESRGKEKIPMSNWLSSNDCINTKGVFKFSKCYKDIIVSNNSNKETGIYPLCIKFVFTSEIINDLREKKIKGFFFVRQPRIPTILCQGYSVGIDRAGYFPMIKYEDNYVVESFKNKNSILTTSASTRIKTTKNSQSSGLICVDAYCNKQLQSMFDTSEFKVEKVFDQSNLQRTSNCRLYSPTNYSHSNSEQSVTNLIYIDPEIPQKTFNDKTFSTKAGMQEDLKYSAYFDTVDTLGKNAELIRGIFTSYIGSTSQLSDGFVYNIRIKNFEESFLNQYFETRMNDNSSYYAISERYCITPKEGATDYKLFNTGGDVEIAVFRGDCFTNTVTTRMHRNFTSSSVPINDTIIDEQTWKEHFKGVRYTTDWNKINKADVDAVPIGSWLTYKCMSNFNMSLRCIDSFQIEEQALMGNHRGFYPLYGISTKSANKINESNLINSGYNQLLGIKRMFTFDSVPYTKDVFDTRIMFSNIQVDGAFKNSYKVFQGLSYEDIDRQYGSITKIIPWGVNLFCVFEHGLAIIPVNEKALLQTTEGANIHMYGSGVLQKQVVLISDKYGSIWKDSIVKTPVAIYGVDTETHKIWRYSDANKLEIISDFKMQRYLHDNIELKELEKYVILGTRNVKTHYNAFKGDVMFTYYNKDKVWNICYNETLGKWVTRYSWTPYMSENIDHSMFSFDLLRTQIFGLLNTNLNRSQSKNDCSVTYNYSTKDHLQGVINENESVSFELNLNDPYNYYNLEKISLKAYYWDDDSNKISFDMFENGGFNGMLDVIINNVEAKKNSEDESLEKQLYNGYISLGGKKHNIKFNQGKADKYLYYNIDLEYSPYIVAEFDPSIGLIGDEDNVLVFGNEMKKYTIGLIRSKINNDPYTNQYDKALVSSIFVHGRSINADEINYFDDDLYNQCLPTKWYDSQEPFEFEVVVNEPKGLHKIFDNLILVSNNVEPNSLEIEITGDVYGFNKAGIYKNEETIFEPIEVIPDKKVYSTDVKWNPIENDYSLLVHQDCINIKEYGRRLGNICYNEDRWYVTLRPIYYKDSILKTTKIRDKYAKIRVKYSGEKLAVIVALQSMFTLSYV